MEVTITTDNYKKHTTQSKAQRLLMDRFYQKLLKEIGSLNAQTILDAGCGEGETLKFLQDHKIGKKLTGIDFLDRAITIGKKNFPRMDLHHADIYKIPYEKNSFDLVICTEVLEHLEKPDKGLQEVRRVTKNYVLLSVPNEPFFMGANFARGKNLSRWGNDIEHINHWTTFQFRKFVRNAGFNIITVSHPFPWTMILAEKR